VVVAFLLDKPEITFQTLKMRYRCIDGVQGLQQYPDLLFKVIFHALPLSDCDRNERRKQWGKVSEEYGCLRLAGALSAAVRSTERSAPRGIHVAFAPYALFIGLNNRYQCLTPEIPGL
jgi:hypothetical protein